MEGLTFPSVTYWYSSVIIAAVVAIIAGVITKLAEGKISNNRAALFIISTAIFAVISYWVMFEGVSNIYLQLGERRETISGCSSSVIFYRRAVQWNPKNGFAQVKYASCMIELNRIDEALDNLRALKDIQADDWLYWYATSILDLANNDFENLKKDINRMLSVNPLASVEAVIIGKELHKNFYYTEAEVILRSVRTHDDSNNYAVFWLAWSLYEQGKYNNNKYYDALHHFDECIIRFQVGYDAGRCHAGKGFTFIQLGQRGDAIAEFSLALQLAPEQDDVRKALNELMP